MSTTLPSQRQVRAVPLLITLCLSLVIVSLDSTVVNVALPSIAEHFRASTSDLEWIVDAYSVPFAGLLLFMGAIGDRIGHRRLQLAGLLLFGLASGLASLAPSVGILIGLRAVMGLAGALVMPASLAILTSAFTGSRRPLALGVWSAAAGAGVAVGPVVGGLLLTEWSWRSVFLINVPLVLVAALAGAKTLPDTQRIARRFDTPGAVLVTGAVVSLITLIIESNRWGWTSTSARICIGATVVLAVAFVLREQLARSRALLRLSWFGDRRLTLAAGSAAGLFFAMVGASFLLMQYLQLVLGYTPLHAGLAILPIVIATAVFATASGALVGLVGHRILIVAGLVALGVGLVLLSTLRLDASYQHILGAGALFGVGVGLALTPAGDLVLGSRAAERPGVASGLNDVAQELGAAIGVAVLGAFTTTRFQGRLQTASATVRAHAGSLTDAITAAQQSGGADQTHLVLDSFTRAMDDSLLLAAAVVLVGAVVAAIGLPGRRREADG